MQEVPSDLSEAVACPPIAGAVLTSTPSYQPYDALMPRIFSKGPVYVTSSSVVPNCARKQASAMLTMMLRKRPKVAERLRSQGALTAVVGRTQNICALPYWDDLTGTPCEAQGGLGGVIGRPATGCAERNLLKQSDDPFFRGLPHGENVCVHELAHTIMNVGVGDLQRSRIRQRFESAQVKTLWQGDFALTNADEFFAEMSQVYFCANPEVVLAPTHNHPVNCASELRAYDPLTFSLIDGIYGQAAADLR
jgi:hypothetical protein